MAYIARSSINLKATTSMDQTVEIQGFQADGRVLKRYEEPNVKDKDGWSTYGTLPFNCSFSNPIFFDCCK